MKKITIVALVALMLLNAALPASAATKATSVEIRGSVATGDFTWDNTTFAGFFYDIDNNLGTETLSINTTDRSIDESQMIYNTTGQEKELKVVSSKYSGYSESQLQAVGLEEFGINDMAAGAGNYTIIGWMAEKYVAIKGKDNKLSKLMVEHGTSSSEKKTLTVGETWDIGGGYTINANSIDAKADPRQVWLTLNRDGVKKDDKVVTTGTGGIPIYTFVEKSLCGENDVPVLVTYVDSIFAGATTDMVQFRYTWLISPTCTEIKSGDVFGSMKVTSTNDPLTLKNSETTLTLASDTSVSVMGNVNLKVAKNTATLRYYPYVEFEIVGGDQTPTPEPGSPGATTPAKTGNVSTTVTTGTGTDTGTSTSVTATATATATATQKEPGFEAIFAIAGLLAVAFLVLRQRK